MPPPVEFQPVEPHPAASLILLRDGADGLEVLMIRRHEGLRFAPGATVFPGGRIDPDDHAPYPSPAIPLDLLPQRMAAIREAFEECGILLTSPPVEDRQLAALRSPAEPPFHERLREAGLEPAVGTLTPFARWQTPETVWRRFDTTFFLARAPGGQDAVVDGGEAVAALWASPPAILEAEGQGRLSLVFATRMNLLRLAPCRTVEDALAEAARHQPMVPILPRAVETPDGPVLRIPAGLGYAPTEFPAGLVRLG
ncbi:NUDIX hydrolase [Azospirillum rugosum]|uniref:8-oxo-dGTP pyrophosphatase MutT (NUDIX family) n=1 Tax=Azospirillum rugosum TaxID=416170 RepID=A0ABS4SZ58_9PROT|nr:NUDIX domain-containing protein [Azospirillum rugosum]MBP2296680.1 8-oxo-dGTP pyrophosphatase MutT (NUDIX family) [Azospirillum rugosum]MDQ0530507.1 8-oxo-dGTP pyrophosphatase MutT (NUDIX family) [Azospirillum rugosum]